MKKLSLIIFLGGLMFVAGKSFGLLSHNVVKADTNAVVYTSSNDPADATYPKGAKIYKEKCAACHQLTGMGVVGAFPPLKGSDYLKANKKKALIRVLNGSNHEITVNGANYSIPMPYQVDNHEDAVAVVNYVLNAWGNDYGTVTLEEAKDVKIVR